MSTEGNYSEELVTELKTIILSGDRAETNLRIEEIISSNSAYSQDEIFLSMIIVAQSLKETTTSLWIWKKCPFIKESFLRNALDSRVICTLDLLKSGGIFESAGLAKANWITVAAGYHKAGNFPAFVFALEMAEPFLWIALAIVIGSSMALFVMDGVANVVLNTTFDDGKSIVAGITMIAGALMKLVALCFPKIPFVHKFSLVLLTFGGVFAELTTMKYQWAFILLIGVVSSCQTILGFGNIKSEHDWAFVEDSFQQWSQELVEADFKYWKISLCKLLVPHYLMAASCLAKVVLRILNYYLK